MWVVTACALYGATVQLSRRGRLAVLINVVRQIVPDRVIVRKARGDPGIGVELREDCEDPLLGNRRLGYLYLSYLLARAAVVGGIGVTETFFVDKPLG